MIILVAGLPGPGKSYFAEKLAGILSAVYLNTDRIRLALHAAGKYFYFTVSAAHNTDEFPPANVLLWIPNG